MHGMPAEAVYLMAALVAAAGILIGVIVSASMLVLHRRTTRLLGLLLLAVGVVAAAGLLAHRDVLELGGNLPWRFVMFGAALAGATLASHAAIHSRLAQTDYSVAALIARGTAAFAVTAAVLFTGLVAVSLMLS